MNLALLHALWIGSGLACVMPMTSSSATGPLANMGMPGAMTAMDMPEMLGGASQSQSTVPTHRQNPCRTPWAPGRCQSMAARATLAIVSAEHALSVDDGAPIALATLRVLMPPSRELPHEPPPPKV